MGVSLFENIIGKYSVHAHFYITEQVLFVSFRGINVTNSPEKYA